jgi:hypothetical protein
MATPDLNRQEKFRIDGLGETFSEAAEVSNTLVEKMKNALRTHRRDADLINSVLTDPDLTDADYMHNGGKSPTIGEYKQGLHAVVSYAHHEGTLTQAEAESILSDAGFSDTTLLATSEIAVNLDPLRV